MAANPQKGVQSAQRFETVPEITEVVSSVPFTVGSAQTIGRRSTQEDSFLVSDLDKQDYQTCGILAVVADGVGGVSNGQVASSTAIRAICAQYAAKKENVTDEELLLSLMAAAQREVRQTIEKTNNHLPHCPKPCDLCQRRGIEL